MMAARGAPWLCLMLALYGATQPVIAVQTYWQNMGDFLEVMSGVSDASMFIDAANAAGIGLGGFSGTLVIPLNDNLVAGLNSLGIAPGQLMAKPDAVRALIQYHMSPQVSIDGAGGAIPTLYNGKTISANGGSFAGDSSSAGRKVVYYVGANGGAIQTAIYLVDNMLVPAGFSLASVGSANPAGSGSGSGATGSGPAGAPGSTGTGPGTAGSTTAGDVTVSGSGSGTAGGSTNSTSKAGEANSAGTSSGTGTGTGTGTSTGTGTGSTSTTSKIGGTGTTAGANGTTAANSTGSTAPAKSAAACAAPATFVAVALAAAALLL